MGLRLGYGDFEQTLARRHHLHQQAYCTGPSVQGSYIFLGSNQKMTALKLIATQLVDVIPLLNLHHSVEKAQSNQRGTGDICGKIYGLGVKMPSRP